MPVINKLLFKWKEPRDPLQSDPQTSISDWAFDLMMVDYEQTRVEELLQSSDRPSSGVKAEINAVGRNCMFTTMPILNVLDSSQVWLKNAGFEPFDFFNPQHRKAMGKALVTKFHKKSENDFRIAIGIVDGSRLVAPSNVRVQ